MLNDLINGVNVKEVIQESLKSIHVNGPSDPSVFEKLAYIKKFHPDVMSEYEPRLVSIMGLFYKSEKPKTLIEEIYSIFSDTILNDTGHRFTPMQASAYNNIQREKYFSFSAPTSSGKSFLFRDIIQSATKDIVIVVPSRALIAEYYHEVISLVDKNVLVLQFIDNINTDNIDRRVFIITPERGIELFKYANDFDIELFLLDEAQISEERIRGMRFDSFVRRVDSVFPDSKKVFAHPFVSNPEAQLEKHGFHENSSSKNYDLHAVGKIFLSHSDGEFEYFSPNNDSGSVLASSDIVNDVLSSNGTLLIYISKKKIYDGLHISEFNKYVQLCNKLKNEDALAIVESLRYFIGASKEGSEKHSYLVDMMERGIVIHHGSMPLKARLLIEDFIKNGYAKICFATSTLSQGVNMPFDVVWIENFHMMEPLVLKNLIGRSGRTTSKKSVFDYGYTILNKKNVPTFKKRYVSSYSISESSKLDENFDDVSEDLKDIVEALKNDSFNDDLHITSKQLERLEKSDINKPIKYILDRLLIDNIPATGKSYYNLGSGIRSRIKSSFKDIFIQHLRRKDLTKAEKSVLSAALPIMLWHIQGRSFSEIVSLRYSFLSERDKRRAVLAKMKRGEISPEDANKQLQEIKVRFSQLPRPIPDSTVPEISTYGRMSVVDLDYDAVVYDTYDYLDKVISQCLVDPICAALEVYYARTKDERATVLKNYIRYGTDDSVEIWLLRYGFGFEEIEWLKDYIDSIDNRKIIFKTNLEDLSEDRLNVISRYL